MYTQFKRPTTDTNASPQVKQISGRGSEIILPFNFKKNHRLGHKETKLEPSSLRPPDKTQQISYLLRNTKSKRSSADINFRRPQLPHNIYEALTASWKGIKWGSEMILPFNFKKNHRLGHKKTKLDLSSWPPHNTLRISYLLRNTKFKRPWADINFQEGPSFPNRIYETLTASWKDVKWGSEIILPLNF